MQNGMQKKKKETETEKNKKRWPGNSRRGEDLKNRERKEILDQVTARGLSGAFPRWRNDLPLYEL